MIDAILEVARKKDNEVIKQMIEKYPAVADKLMYFIEEENIIGQNTIDVLDELNGKVDYFNLRWYNNIEAFNEQIVINTIKYHPENTSMELDRSVTFNCGKFDEIKDNIRYK